VLGVNGKKDTDKSIGKPFFEGKSVAAPRLISMILTGKHLPGHAGVVYPPSPPVGADRRGDSDLGVRVVNGPGMQLERCGFGQYMADDLGRETVMFVTVG
jgi:hypothetical protein